MRFLLLVLVGAGCVKANNGYSLDDLAVSEPDLGVPDLSAPDLVGVDLAGNDLRPTAADLSGVDLAGADLAGADLAVVDLARLEDLAGADLATVVCTDDTLGKGCASATNIGAVHVGGTVPITGVLPMAGEENWIRVSFPDSTSAAFHPHVTIGSVDGDIAFDVFSNCNPSVLSCGEGGTSTSRTNWEVFKTGCIDADAGCQSSPLVVGNAGTVFIRVFRKTLTPTCHSYTLVIAD